MRFPVFIFSVILFLFSFPVSAHETGSPAIKRAEPEKVAVNERFQLSLVVQGSEVSLFVKDRNGTPVSLDIASASVFARSGDKTHWFTLYPNESGELLSGRGQFLSDKTAKLDVTLRLPGEQAINASFTPAVSENPTAMKQ